MDPGLHLEVPLLDVLLLEVPVRPQDVLLVEALPLGDLSGM
jgi:hypothetical protein